MSHYSLGQKTGKLIKWAERMALSFIDHDIKQPVLVYSGMSGISAATALSIALKMIGIDVGMIYVRKDNEDSHGGPVEREIKGTWFNRTYIFVDDFISSGATYEFCGSKAAVDFTYVAVQERLWDKIGVYELLSKQEIKK